MPIGISFRNSTIAMLFLASSHPPNGFPLRCAPACCSGADDVIERYRNNSDPAIEDFDWQKAAGVFEARPGYGRARSWRAGQAGAGGRIFKTGAGRCRSAGRTSSFGAGRPGEISRVRLSDPTRSRIRISAWREFISIRCEMSAKLSPRFTKPSAWDSSRAPAKWSRKPMATVSGRNRN